MKKIKSAWKSGKTQKLFSKVLAYVAAFSLLFGSLNIIGFAEELPSPAPEDTAVEADATEEAAEPEVMQEQEAYEEAAGDEQAADADNTEAATEAPANEQTSDDTNEDAPTEAVTEAQTEEPTEDRTEEQADRTTEDTSEETQSEEDEEENRYATPRYKASATITKDTSKTAEQLAKSLVGAGIEVTNVKASGSVFYVENGAAVGMSGGVGLDTHSGASEHDANLAALISSENKKYGGHTSTLQFSMVANGPLLNFNYMFASSEFSWGSTYNDIFGLFVSVNGGAYENIALLDNGRHITITNLRAGRSGKEMGNGTNTNIVSGTIYDYFTAKSVGFGGNICNGVSHVFQAQKAVHIGDTVTVKFVIADVGDDAYDSVVMIEKGSLNFMPDSKVNYEEEVLGNLETNAKYEIQVLSADGKTVLETHTFQTTTDNKIPLEGTYTDKNGATVEYNLLGKKLSIVQKDIPDGGDSEAQILNIGPRPDPPDDPNVPKEVTEGKVPVDLKPGDVKTTSDSVIVIKPAPGQEYSIDDGKTWKRSTNNEEIVFSPLPAGKDIKIITRFYATDSAPKSYPSDGVTVKVKNMLSATAAPYVGVYDALSHTPAVVSPTPGVKVTYCLTQDGTYSEVPPQLIDVGSYTLYYLVELDDNYYPAYGMVTVDITKRPLTVTPVDEQSKCVGDTETELQYNISGNVLSETPAFTGALDRLPGEEEGSYKIGQGSLALQDNGSFKADNYDLQVAEGFFFAIKCHEDGTEVEENHIKGTCTKPGSYDTAVYCTVCGKEIGRKTHVVPAGGHQYGAWVEIDAARCMNPGLRQRTCKVCGFIETQNLNPIGHDWTDDYVTDKEPTCLTDGSKSIHCNRCGVAKDSEVIPRLDHIGVVDEAVAATCTTAGKTEGSHCIMCNTILKTQIPLPAFGHNWGEWRLVREATTKIAGRKEQLCQNGCGAVQYEDIPKIEVDRGTLTKSVIVNDGALIAYLDTDEEVLEIGIFTEDEREQIEEGTNVSVWVEISPASPKNLSEEDAAELEREAKEQFGEDIELASYDIRLFKRVGDAAPIQLYEPDIPLTLTFDIPASLLAYDELSVRNWGQMIRLHNSEAEVLVGSYDDVEAKFTVETDKFSFYTLCFKDIPEDETEDEEPELDDVPKTGENAGTQIWYWFMMLGGAGTLILQRRKKLY